MVNSGCSRCSGAAIQFFFGRRLSNKAVSAVSVGLPGLVVPLGASGALSQFLGLPESYHHVFLKHLYTWLPAGAFHLSNGSLGNLNVNVGMQLDPLSCVMMLVVTGVGFLIHVYSIGYMAHEGGYYRFFGYLNLFMFSMLVLVLADNYLMMFVGWEGVGLCSYLLIGFYFLRKSASDAGKKAFIVNRIGDAAFLLGMMLMVVTFGTLDFHSITEAARSGAFPDGQWGYHHHLHFAFHRRHGEVRADSALHLAAGRHGRPHAGQRLDSCRDHGDGGRLHGGALECAFSRFPPRRWRWVAGIGAATAIWAASIGLVQNDIKRVLAYSTVSQLGYMFLACGVGAFTAGVFHLMTHAFFKALLFLGSGSVIHAMSGEQDMRKMGGLVARFP